LDKFIRHQALHLRILERLQNAVPKQVFEKIKKAREEHLKRFKDVMLKLENKNQIPEKLEKALEKIKGSRFQAISSLEFLKKVKTIVPEDQKQEIQKAEDKIMEKFKDRFQNMPPQVQEKFNNYLDKISENKEEQLNILENLQKRLQNRPDIQKRLMRGKEKIIKRIINIRQKKEKECLEKYLPHLPDKIKACVDQKVGNAVSPLKPEKIGQCIKGLSPEDMAKVKDIGKKLSECIGVKPKLPLNQEQGKRLEQILRNRIEIRAAREKQKIKKQEQQKNNASSAGEQLEKIKNLAPTKIPANLPKIQKKGTLPQPRY